MIQKWTMLKCKNYYISNSMYIQIVSNISSLMASAICQAYPTFLQIKTQSLFLSLPQKIFMKTSLLLKTTVYLTNHHSAHWTIASFTWP